jgi:hypothetical protein
MPTLDIGAVPSEDTLGTRCARVAQVRWLERASHRRSISIVQRPWCAEDDNGQESRERAAAKADWAAIGLQASSAEDWHGRPGAKERHGDSERDAARGCGQEGADRKDWGLAASAREEGLGARGHGVAMSGDRSARTTK